MLDHPSAGSMSMVKTLAECVRADCRFDLAVCPELDRLDIGADRADLIGICCASIARPASELRRLRRPTSLPTTCCACVITIPVRGTVGGHQRGTGDLDFFFVEAERSLGGIQQVGDDLIEGRLTHGAECGRRRR